MKRGRDRERVARASQSSNGRSASFSACKAMSARSSRGSSSSMLCDDEEEEEEEEVVVVLVVMVDMHERSLESVMIVIQLMDNDQQSDAASPSSRCWRELGEWHR